MGWLIGPVFLAAAIWFFVNSGPTAVPLAERVTVSPAEIERNPSRPLPDTPPRLDIAGFSKKCTECHSLFRTHREQPLILSQHRNIVQGHGMNDRCFNCHDDRDPSRLVLLDGATVPLAESATLCARCHGTTYRDWERGMHGRTTGSWQIDSDAHGQLTCTQCHDPHAPAFAPMSVLAGPNTLRMGEEPPHHDSHERRNPLRHWSSGSGEVHP